MKTPEYCNSCLDRGQEGCKLPTLYDRVSIRSQQAALLTLDLLGGIAHPLVSDAKYTGLVQFDEDRVKLEARIAEPEICAQEHQINLQSPFRAQE